MPAIGYLLGGQVTTDDAMMVAPLLPEVGPALFNKTADVALGTVAVVVEEPVVILPPPPPPEPPVTPNVTADPLVSDAPVRIVPWTVHACNFAGVSLVVLWAFCLWYKLRFERAERRRAKLRRLRGPSDVRGVMPHYDVYDTETNPDQPEWDPNPKWLEPATPELERAGSAPVKAKDPYARPTHKARAEFVQAKNDRHLAPVRVDGEKRPVKRPAVLQVSCLDQCLYRLCCMVTSWAGTRVLFLLATASIAAGYMEVRTKRTVVVEESGWDYWGAYFQGKAYDIASVALLQFFYDRFMGIAAVGTFGSLLAMIPCCWCCRMARQQSHQLDAIEQRQMAAAPKPVRALSHEEKEVMVRRDNRFKRVLSVDEHDRLTALNSAASGVTLGRAESLKAISKVEAGRVATLQKAIGRKLGRPSVVLNKGHQPGAHKKKNVQRPLVSRVKTWIREKLSGRRYDPRLATEKEEMRLVPPAPVEVQGPDPIPVRVFDDPSAPSQYVPLDD